ncbi:OB-fold nucleic acid binding domain-containing protein [Haloglomus litoreum]|uniref:OB-fold nucleic acid binding domain-containing protein n=1 Tax=Haloglomus litoreum TaxID=3034026 RepID=UPI0023E7CE4D|nr:OB-fold nucleic acid binding domain-containing protein [Haloglomus sp. DT116]
MGNCIICGTATDGPICDTHQEDVVFEFEGNSPSQLTEGRFYEGTVDGYADFGVFVDLSRSVTGLLHRSKLDRRLESLDWEPGDSVFVQVTNVRDNGDVDLGWSIRQSDRDFRGRLIDSPDGDYLADEDDDEDDGGAGDSSQGTSEPEPVSEPDDDSEEETETSEATGESQAHSGTAGGSEAPSGRDSEPAPTAGQGRADAASEDATPEADEVTEAATDDSGAESEPDVTTDDSGAESEPDVTTDDSGAESEPDVTTDDSGAESEPDVTTDDSGTEEQAEPTEAERASVEDLRERVGDVIAIEGEIVSVRQTSGPTVFELRDETAVVDCAAFEEAGVRAYPEVETGDIVRLTGEVRVRRDELQVETEELVVLADGERETVEQRMAEALTEEAEPERVEPLAVDEVVSELNDDLHEAATAIRRAVAESRPVVIRHAATTDGYVAGAAIERAVLPLVAEEHAASDASYHYFDRRPLEGAVYDMDDATKDVTGMLGDQERHDEKFPLFVFAAAGGTRESMDGFDLLDVYDAERVVVDGQAVDEEVREAVETTVAPDAGSDERTAATVGATLAAAINDAIRDDLGHLPAVSYWDDAPEQYVTLAEEAGVDAETAAQLREAVALEAYYQSYEDKRELIIDLLFERGEGGDGVGLAEQVSEQFDTKLEAEMDTALANLERREAAGVSFAVLDTDSYTHRFDFPPKRLLLDELHRREAEGDRFVTIGIAKDELFLRATEELDLRGIAEEVAEEAEHAGVAARGAREGKIEFLSGERDAVLKAVIKSVADRVAAAA